MTDLEALWEAVRQNPHQDAPLNMLMDELIERGDDRTAAVLKWSSGLRWNVQLVKRPKPVLMAVEMLLGSIEDLPPFEAVTEARAEVTVRDEFVPPMYPYDRLLVRSWGFAFVAVMEAISIPVNASHIIECHIMARSVGRIVTPPSSPDGRHVWAWRSFTAAP